jgi:hypothetical protein
MSQRPLLIVVVLAVIGVVAVLLTRAREEKKPVPVAVQATATPVAVAAVPSPMATRAPERRVVRTETYFEPLDDQQINGQQAAAAAARYRKAARYPRTSRPLEDGLDPIANTRIPPVDREGDAKHPEPRLIVYPSVTNFEAPGEVLLYAEVFELRMAPDRGEDGRGPERERPRQFRVGASSVRGVLQTMDGVVIAPLVFRDDGTHGDAQANDDYFTATYTPDPDKPKEFHGQYQVVAQAVPNKGPELTASTTFVYSVSIAHLTGNYRDSIVNGNLQIDAEIQVEEPGHFRVESTLVRTKDATMITYGYGEGDLDVGAHWLPITYAGLAFHDMKADGPYSMFSTMLSTIDPNGSRESDVVPNAHTTKPYKMTDFSDQPFNDPEYLRKAEYYENLARQRAAEEKSRGSQGAQGSR